MNNKKNILIVEHDPNDLELIEFELKNSGLNYVSKAVQNETDFTLALRNFVPDIILCDYLLPSFDGSSAFEIKKQIAHDTPFIIVSGHIGEEKSIELIKTGVTDYVLKDKLFTLPTKVKRALLEAIERQQKNKIQYDRAQSESRLKEAQTIAHIGSWEINLEHNVHQWSDEMFSIFGIRKDEVLPSTESFLLFIHPDDLAYVSTSMETAFNTHTDSSFNFRFIRKDGILRHGHSRYRFEFDEGRTPMRLYGIIQDVTEKKLADDKLVKANRLYAFISQVNQTIVHVKEEGKLFHSACRIASELGKFKMAWIGVFDKLNKAITMVEQAGIPEEDIKLFMQAPYCDNGPQECVLRNGVHFICNDIQKDFGLEDWKPFAKKNGIYSVMVLPIKKSGDIIGTFNLYAGEINFFDTEEIALLDEATGDISFALNIIENEKKHKETAELVIQNEARFRALSEKSADMITLSNKKGELIYGSPSVTKVLGYSLEEFLLKRFSELIHVNDALSTAEIFERLQTPDKSFSLQQRILHKNGSWIWCEGTITNMFDEPGVQALVSNFRDISEKKKAERQKEFDENNLNALINNTKDLMWSVDRDFNLITSNQPFDEMSKVNFGRVIEKRGNVLSTATTPSIRKHHKQQYERAFEGEAFTEIEHFNLPVECWTQISYYPIRKGDQIIGTACISRDITEQKRTDEKVRENEKRYRNTLDNMVEGCQIVDFNWRYVYVNLNAAKQNQNTSEVMLGKTMMELYPGFESTNIYATLKNCMDNKQEQQMESKFTFPNGTSRVFNIRVQPSPEGIFIQSNDVSERKNAERALLEYNERYEIVSKATNDAIWDWDIENHNQTWNHGMQTIFGYTEREIKGTRIWWRDNIHALDHDRIDQELGEAFAKKTNNWTSQYQYLCADGSYKYVLDRAYIIYRESKPIRMIGAMQDITEVVHYRQGLEHMVEERTHKLNKALNKEKELVDMKSKFISIASHEFRTPLTTISLAAGLIKKYAKKMNPDELDNKLDNIEKQVSHMTYLLDDVLTIGKADAGKIEVVLSKVDIGFFKRLATEVIESATTPHILQYEQDCKITSVTTSEKLIRNIIFNLLTNAIKFSPGKNEVLMKVVCDQKNIIITVKDLGMGIPVKDIKNLFTSFSRGSNVEAIEGTGLGLSIVKKAVDLLNGTISVKSKIKLGSEFKVTLPLHHAKPVLVVKNTAALPV
jgi:PAS domain S-box-containing protein